MWASILWNKKTSILGGLIILGSFVKLLMPGQEAAVDQITTNLGGVFEGVIQIILGVGLLLAKDGTNTGTAK